MPVQLICCSHSPLMTAEMEESQQGVQAQFFREMDTCAAALHQFDPDLVVLFGPDHFNGFFYELMPASVSAPRPRARRIGTSKVDRCGCRASSLCPACVSCKLAISTWRSPIR